MAATEKQTNEGYINIPQSLYALRADGRRLPLGAVTLGGLVFSFSGNGRKCTRTYAAFGRDLGLSAATVGRSCRMLKCDGVISTDRQSRYTYNDESAGRLYFRANLSYFTDLFKIKGETQPRRLTPAEAHVLALIATRCDNRKHSKKSYTASAQDIADELHVSKKTALRAINTLLRADAIHRSCENKGVNGVHKSAYTLAAKYRRREKKQPSETTPPTQEEKRIARERYYAELRYVAEERAERNAARALAYAPFREADRAVKSLGIAAAFAEAKGDKALPELERRLAEAQRDRLRALAELAFSEDDLKPKYRCRKCGDTGFNLNTGQPCGCYPEGRN